VTRTYRASAVLGALGFVCGCAPLVPVRPGALPALTDDLEPTSLRVAVERTVPAYARPEDGGRTAAARRLVAVVEGVTEPRDRSAAVAREFRVVRFRKPLLLTAYYEPELAGRLVPDPIFHFPIYSRPAEPIDLARGVIDAGALAGRGLELAWTDDPVGLFLLHVQGSGSLRLADGTRLGLRYAGTNGRPYRSLGRTLIDRGLLPEGGATVPDIRRVLASMPTGDVMSLLATNERYTFFRIADGGPVGSLGVELTPGRSVATDPALVPPGTLGYLVTPSVRRFVVSQDTGAAITGTRADLFLGAGVAAENTAGRMQERGTLYLLFPR
jgi:membrane-bound lytic murein transglycosylase A